MKTPEEMKAAATQLRKAAASLPGRDIFGDNNADDIAEMIEWADCLDKAADGQDYSNPDVTEWVYGTYSPICDCLD